MIKDNQRILNRIYIIIDACVIAGSYCLAWLTKFRSGIFESYETLPPSTYFSALLAVVPGYLMLYYFLNLYGSKRKRDCSMGGIRKTSQRTV